MHMFFFSRSRSLFIFYVNVCNKTWYKFYNSVRLFNVQWLYDGNSMRKQKYAWYKIPFVTRCSLTHSHQQCFSVFYRCTLSTNGSYAMHIVHPNEFIDIKYAIHYHFWHMLESDSAIEFFRYNGHRYVLFFFCSSLLFIAQNRLIQWFARVRS